MATEIPSFAEIRELLIAAMSGRIPEANVNRYGDTYKRLSVNALGVSSVHNHLRQVELDLLPDTAQGTY